MRFWIVAALLVLACPAQLQSQESGKVSYEGQKVGVVEVVANPKISVDPYRPLIQLKSGDLYSNRQARRKGSTHSGCARWCSRGAAKRTPILRWRTQSPR